MVDRLGYQLDVQKQFFLRFGRESVLDSDTPCPKHIEIRTGASGSQYILRFGRYYARYGSGRPRRGGGFKKSVFARTSLMDDLLVYLLSARGNRMRSGVNYLLKSLCLKKPVQSINFLKKQRRSSQYGEEIDIYR